MTWAFDWYHFLPMTCTACTTHTVHTVYADM